MDRYELLQKITTFPLIAGTLAESLLSGDFRSVFKGQGIEADEVRHYERGDDIRSIDWNVSARFGTPYVKMYREEREMTVSIVLDCSASMYCGSGSVTPFDQALLSAGLIAFSAERAGQRIGILFFDQDIIKVFPPRKSRSHIMAMISAALSIEPVRKGSNLGAALVGQGRLLKRRSLVVVISDFLSVNWEQELGDLCRKHDVIAIRVRDALSIAMINLGLISMEDPETGVKRLGPTGFSSFRSAWSEWHRDRLSAWQGICRRLGGAFLDIATDADVPSALIHFFGGRGGPKRL
ncbi:MAG: DUF58 domain-containing protein [Treponema sp.]|jgi:uncharacterized protein (DUF58 family)|nr:DUF58 domain-containing protein [Treponema sp.]